MRNVIKLPTPPVKEWPPEMVARCERLRPYRGQFVAETANEVLFGSDDPHEVVAWLRGRGIKGAAVMFVPVDPSADLLLDIEPIGR